MFRFDFFPFHWFYFLLVIIGVAPSFSQTDCDESAVEKCADVLHMVLKNPNIAFPVTEDQVEVACGYYNQYVSCITHLANRCFKPYARDAFMATFSGTVSLVSDMCTTGSPYRAEFLKYSSCFKSIERELLSCVDKYTAEGEALKSQKLSDEERIKKSCCYMNGTTECLAAPTKKKCGTAPADFFRRSFEKAYGPLAMICSGFEYDAAVCNSASSSITASGFLFLILSIILSLKH